MFWKYFKTPLRNDGYGVYVFTDNGRMALDWMTDLEDCDKERIVTQINYPMSYGWKYNKLFSYDGNTHILYDNKPFLRVRGWGMLTGIGGFHLSSDYAKKIQDEFANFIIKQLNRF